MTGPLPGDNRVCRQVQALLPAVVAGSLPRWRRRLVALHLRRCVDCAAELEHQRTVAAALDELATVEAADDDPPQGLLDTLLDQAGQPGLRGRAAVPVRGAVSGARPGVAAALLVAGALAGTAAGYASWRGARAVRTRLHRRGG